METERTLKKDWEVTPDAFEKLLEWLDPDIEAAAEKYEKVRQKLVKLSKWRNCIPEEEYADITINRVTRRVYENTPVNVTDPYLYFHGTALNVIREYWRGRLKHKHEDIDTADPTSFSVGDVEDEIDAEDERRAEQRRLGCMRGCINELPQDSRDLIVEYHHGDNKKETRKRIAERLGVGLNVLRIRACRLREGLQTCVEKCVRRAA